MESLDVIGLHGVLLSIGSVFLGLGQITGNFAHLGLVVTEDQAELLAL